MSKLSDIFFHFSCYDPLSSRMSEDHDSLLPMAALVSNVLIGAAIANQFKAGRATKASLFVHQFLCKCGCTLIMSASGTN